MTVSPAPAAMPSEEELSTLLRCYGEFGTTESRERAQSRECAAAILSLFQERFASILAEKDVAKQHRDSAMRYAAECSGRAGEAEARALAAEAALEKAREEIARLQAVNRAFAGGRVDQPPMTAAAIRVEGE